MIVYSVTQKCKLYMLITIPVSQLCISNYQYYLTNYYYYNRLFLFQDIHIIRLAISMTKIYARFECIAYVRGIKISHNTLDFEIYITKELSAFFSAVNIIFQRFRWRLFFQVFVRLLVFVKVYLEALVRFLLIVEYLQSILMFFYQRYPSKLAGLSLYEIS